MPEGKWEQSILKECLAVAPTVLHLLDGCKPAPQTEKMEEQDIADECLALVLCGAASFNQAHQHHTIEK